MTLKTCVTSRVSKVVLMTAIILLAPLAAHAQIKVWANEGGDKVTQDELRASSGASVNSSVWDGATVHLFGAKNEVIGFNLVLEAPTSNLSNVSVQFNRLTGPNGSVISSQPTSGDGVFDWRTRNIELFLVRYLQIKGISTNTYSNYDERHTPERMRRPYTGEGIASGTWNDRPDHDKYYPDIAVPLEASPSFSISARSNQSIWTDIYVPKTAAAGTYTGTVTVTVGGSTVSTIPVQLQVHNFALPDSPSAKTMMVYTPYDVNERYFGTGYINPTGTQGPASIQVRDRHFMLAHRHKISLVDENYEFTGDQPSPYEWPRRLDGSLFTPANGYDGPGVSTGNNVFAVGLYGTWNWKSSGQSGMWTHTDNWEKWFQANSPQTERFLYLADESSNYTQTQQWAGWVKSNPGPGANLQPMATIDLPTALQNTPSLGVPTSTIYVGNPSTWDNALNTLKTNAKNRFFLYNGHRPATGTFATEDDGVALRQLAWTQYKRKIDRWYFWQSTYYNNNQGGTGETNVLRQAQTFGATPSFDSTHGQTSWGYSNGDGVMFYPGTDKLFPSDSLGLNGPIASLRLKYWRRGIQDVDYLTMAAAINPAATKQIVDAIIPKVLWEYGVDSLSDPTYKHTDISWSTDPDVWEQARASLASIIETGTGTAISTPTPAPTPVGSAATPTPAPTVAAGGAPAAPASLAATAPVSNQLALTWADRSSNESGFKIERSIDGTNFSLAGTVGANVTSYTDTGLNAWTTYAYRIYAFNSAGSSPYTAYAYKTTLTTNGTTNVTAAATPSSGVVPAAPTGLGSTATVSRQIALSWSDKSSNESGFKIERSIDGVNFSQVATVGANVTSFVDTGLNTWTTYAYRIAAYDSAGSSAYSNYTYRTTLTY